MNSPSDARQPVGKAQGPAVETMAVFLAPQTVVAPFEYRSLSGGDMEAVRASAEARGASQPGERGTGQRAGKHDASDGRDYALREVAARSAVDAARQQGTAEGDREGRRAARAELEAETRAAVGRERVRLVETVKQFQVLRERYFTEVEQEVVKLALAIAARVLHREAQIDPLLLTGVVRVALEKMADRGGAVVRVAGADVAAWEQVFQTMEASERPRVAEDSRLERGECVLETRMGTVELGVSVQLAEIEKGFFDLLHHKPVA
jgi:flagellar assembly protein FliH